MVHLYLLHFKYFIYFIYLLVFLNLTFAFNAILHLFNTDFFLIFFLKFPNVIPIKSPVECNAISNS